MHRMYICTRFTCFTCTAKMASFTGLWHSDNTKHWDMAVAPGRVQGGSKPLTSFQTKESFEKTYYKCIAL